MGDTPDLETLVGGYLLTPQSAALGLERLHFGEARAALRLPFDARLVAEAEMGVIAGGAVTTLLDHTCGLAVWAALARYGAIATLDLRIDYMRPARQGAAVIADAHCYRLTRSIAFVRAHAYDEDPDDWVAAAQAAFMLDSSAARSPGAEPEAEAT